jgi:glutamate--cysteine ligase
LSLGFHPFARLPELPRVPKLRYGIMEQYLPTRGSRPLDMMFRTSTVQANLDYSSEADAIRKLRVSLALQPIVTAMFANSPCYENHLGSRLSERADVWLHMDPDRTGLLPFAWDREMSFQRYVDWALDVPMFLIKRGAHVVPNTHQTFRKFLREGSEGQRATVGDWKTHINTLFPEVRLKNTLEMRGADAQPTDLICALPSLWKGLLYDDRALEQAERLITPLNPSILDAARSEIARDALSARLLGRSLQEWASEVVQIAWDGLDRQARKNDKGETETVHLSRLRSQVAEGKTAATLLRSRVAGATDFRAAVIEAARI